MKLNTTPPRAGKVLKKLTLHGDTRIDPYFWLREKQNPLTMKYLNEENEYFTQQLAPLKNFKNKLYKEMKSRVQENDSSVPAKHGPWLYSRKFKKGLQYAIEVRTPCDGAKKEQVLLDLNKLAKGKKYLDVRGLQVSPNHHLLAYAADFDGSEKYSVHFKDLRTDKLLKDQLQNSNGSMVFANDNKTFFYIVLDENLRPYRVFKHTLGTDSKKDQLIYEEKNAQFFLSLDKSASGNFIFIGCYGKVTSEVWIVDAHNPSLAPECFLPRKEGVEYSLDHRGDEFWIRTNHQAQNFKILKCPISKTSSKNWVEVISHSKDIFRGSFHLTEKFLVVQERQVGLPQIRIYNLENNKNHLIQFKEEAYSVSLHPDNLEFETEILRISYSSLITPPSVIDYNMITKKSKVLKTAVVKGHNPANYICRRIWVPGHDGVKIPMVVVHKKSLKPQGAHPTYLYGYGSYGHSIPDGFFGRMDLYRMIDRGFVFALAHIRGGSEMGRQWYENGKFLKKKNTFLDFISCAEYLKKSKLTHPEKLAIAGGSAGGMLVGACMNMKPDLFNLVIAHVPFVDVLNTMLDKDLPLTQIEYKEWGNPQDKKYYKYIKSYSPYDNVEAKNYPTMFVTCGLNDPRVTYWEPAKWVAKLRELKTDNNTILFKTNMGAGHFGQSGRFSHLQENAEEFAFILSRFGILK